MNMQLAFQICIRLVIYYRQSTTNTLENIQSITIFITITFENYKSITTTVTSVTFYYNLART